MQPNGKLTKAVDVYAFGEARAGQWSCGLACWLLLPMASTVLLRASCISKTLWRTVACPCRHSPALPPADHVDLQTSSILLPLYRQAPALPLNLLLVLPPPRQAS